MVYKEIIEGKTISLRSTIIDDAAFIIDIRNDNEKSKYVHPVDNDIDAEIEWIREQRKREGDYFFTIIRNSDGALLGNVAVCNIDINTRCGELGRWVSYGTAVENLETIIAVHDFAFSVLGLEQLYTKTLSGNKSVVNFWKRFGGTGEEKSFDGISCYYNVITAVIYENQVRKLNNELLMKVVKV